ncbi:hypothetical protein [Streptomyces spinosisporus]|uniref:Uncharacterized protein n=1 Tax=Streptomyces spinosisporus TaxID=2927582 RepID=A0ABS9XDZ9_9ACTN|nr:hypothetical protein [Streptomyces spinosisporus]MCI3240275.1 hypothetical protein [Streptomyces spinosisporus]
MKRPAEDEPAEQAEELGEEDEPSRAAKGAVIVVLALIVWRLLVAFPNVAYVIVGILGTLGVQKWQAWRAKRSDATEAAEEAVPPDVGAALRRLVGDDNGVLLTRLQRDLKLPNTKVVKRLLDADGITWKAVRTPHGNGPGVHKNDIPAAPPLVADAHSEGCCCRSGDNSNSNNGLGEGPGEGIRVERTDAGLRIFDLLEDYFNSRGR